jgi:hypothetical protein
MIFLVILLQVIAGAAGGHLIFLAKEREGLGLVLNAAVGAVGGVVIGQILMVLAQGILAAQVAAATGGLDLTGLLGGLISGGIGGAVAGSVAEVAVERFR